MSSKGIGFGRAVAAYRALRGYTQEDLAIRADLTKLTIAKYERGAVDPLKNARKVAEALGVPLERLVTGGAGSFSRALETEFDGNET